MLLKKKYISQEWINLKELNNLIIRLSVEVNEKITLIQLYITKKYDSNNFNFIINKIINEEDEEKKLLLMDKMNKNNDIDSISLDYINQLFSIFNNNENFCLKE